MNKVFRQAISGLYAITPDEPDTAELLRKVRQALGGGTRVLQYRNKLADALLVERQAHELRDLTLGFGATFIVNDDPALAARVEADGVHLGGEDGSVASARACLGVDKIVGVSCYNRLSLALDAAKQGADYVAFGAFFSSSVKPEAVVAPHDLLRQARRELDIPIVAIGGITAENGGRLIAAGADALAVISAVFAAPDIRCAAEDFSNLFRQGNSA